MEGWTPHYEEDAEALLTHARLETQAALHGAALYRQALLTDALYAYTINITTNRILEVLRGDVVMPSLPCPYDPWLETEASKLPSELQKQYLQLFQQRSLLDSYEHGEQLLTLEYPLDRLFARHMIIVTRDWQSGELHGLCVIKDISMERSTSARFHTEIRGVYDMFSLLAEHTTDISILINRASHAVEYISPNIRWLLGTSNPRVWYDTNHRLYFEGWKWDSRFGRLLESREPSEEIKSDFIPVTNSRTQERFWVCVHLYPIEDADKYIVTISDRTREHRQQEQLQQALEEAARAGAAKSDFLSRMSHDIRTPLNAIMGMNQIAVSHLDDPERVRDCLYKMSRSSEHLLSLINEVLDMSHIESGRLELILEPLSVTSLLESLSTLIRPQAADKDQLLTIDCDLRHDTVMGDAVRLTQIFTNIAGNAVKYTPKGGTIAVLLQETDAGYEFSCKDSGIGMNASFIPHIFEPFTRETDSRTGKIPGTGLGMSIVQNLVRLMKGDIHVESAPGQGSTFRVLLPLEVVEAPDSDPVPDSAAPDFTGLRALLVEDNDLNLEIASDLLRLLGLSVNTARDGVEALDTMQTGTYDLIFMDIQMPRMNGYEAARELRRRGCRQPIIAMTANAFAEDVRKALDAGMNGHIPKPLDINAIIKTLQTVQKETDK